MLGLSSGKSRQPYGSALVQSKGGERSLKRPQSCRVADTARVQMTLASLFMGNCLNQARRKEEEQENMFEQSETQFLTKFSDAD
eukprot:679990-Amphidinium_carterae.1